MAPEIIDDKKNIAIVAVGYNRLGSMRRLLDSLNNAHYNHDDIPLVISIDCSGDTELYDYVQSYEWMHGPKYINIQEKRLGLKNHIFQCGDLTKHFRAVIVLEDDIFVSEYFYQYVEKAVDFYYDENRVGGISLYQNEIIGSLPKCYLNDGSDTYLKQAAASWGECWTDKQWKSFKDWYVNFSDDDFKDLDIPEHTKSWKKAWSKYFFAYLVSTGRYFVFPQISRTTCFSDAGEHSSFSTNIGQANLIVGESSYFFKPFDKMIRYDIYGTNEDIYEWIGIEQKDLCVDFCCDKINIRKCRYILTPAKMNHKIVKSFGLYMQPIELNIKYDIEGKMIFLYDTITGEDNANRVGMPSNMSFYYLKGFSPRLAFKYSMQYLISIIKHKIGIK